MKLLTKEEMWDVVRRLRPDMTYEQFERLWKIRSTN